MNAKDQHQQLIALIVKGILNNSQKELDNAAH